MCPVSPHLSQRWCPPPSIARSITLRWLRVRSLSRFGACLSFCVIGALPPGVARAQSDSSSSSSTPTTSQPYALYCAGSVPQIQSIGGYDVPVCPSGTGELSALPGPWYSAQVDPDAVQQFFASVLFVMCVLIVVRMVDREFTRDS